MYKHDTRTKLPKILSAIMLSLYLYLTQTEEDTHMPSFDVRGKALG